MSWTEGWRQKEKGGGRGRDEVWAGATAATVSVCVWLAAAVVPWVVPAGASRHMLGAVAMEGAAVVVM